VLDGIDSEGRLAEAARTLSEQVGQARKRPRELLDAVLAWVVRESEAFRPAARAQARLLSARPADFVLVASSLAPFLAIALG
jgi:hypothetical protein